MKRKHIAHVRARRRSPKVDLPVPFDGLCAILRPCAIATEAQLDGTIAIADRVMAIEKFTREQSLYLETLIQLIEAYESVHHRIGDVTGLELLRYLLQENEMSGADLGRLLGVHASTGSKILRGERSLTVEHVKKLGARFHVKPGAFID